MEKITSHCFLLCFVLESVGLNVFSAKSEKFSLIIEVDGNVFFHKTFRTNDASLLPLFISMMYYYWLYERVTGVDKDVPLT